MKIAKKEALLVRQTYTRTLKKLSVAQRFRNHPKNKSKARKADRKVKTIAGRLVRELERKLSDNTIYQKEINIFKQAHKKRAAIEPTIGHLKTDHRLARNFYKGVVGDNVNIMLAAANFNFKRMMNKWKSSFCLFFQEFFYAFKIIFLKNCNLKCAF